MNKMKPVVEGQLKTDVPEFGAGDTVSIDVRVVEGGKERVQKFQGIVIGRKAVTFLKRLPFGRFPAGLVSNGFSQFIHPWLRILK